MQLHWSRNKSDPNSVTSYWLDVQNGPSKQRYSIVKDFDFVGGFKGSFFSSQKKCVNKGKQYKWLVYERRSNDYKKESKELENEWNSYKTKLGEHADDLVQCRVLALEPEEEPLSWNFTIYENEMCIVERAQEGSFENDNTTIIFDNDKVTEMEKLFLDLWEVCPSIDYFIESESKGIFKLEERKIISTKHSNFSHIFFQFLGREYHKHVPIYKIEKELNFVRWTLFLTLGLLGAATISLILPLLKQTFFH